MKNTDLKNPLRLLLVEDSDSDAALFEENILSSGVDFSVSRAKSLKEAMSHLGSNHTDAALLDLTLPDSSGLDTVRQVRNSQPALPVVVLTGIDDEKIGVEAVRLGAQDYLIKGKADGQTIIRAVNYAIERKHTEDELRRSREDLNRAQAVAQVGSWRMDVQKNELTWSDENHHIFGIPKGTPMTYETFLGTIHPDDKEYVDQKWQAALAGEPYDVEHRIIVNGDIKWVRERANLELDRNGKLLGGFGTTQDITQAKRIEEQIKNLAKFPSEDPYPVLRILKNGKIEYSNSAGMALLKYWQKKVGDEVPSEWKNLVEEAVKRKHRIFKELALNESVISYVLAPIPESGYVNIYGRDITEYRDVEKELQAVNLGLESRVKERTEQLQHLIEVLQKEVTERTKAEQQLIDNQEKLRLLSSEIIITEERERREIATQLHDSIGQLLAFSKKELGVLTSNAPQEVKASLQKVWELIKQAVEQTRTLTFDLSSATLYTLGLEAAIEELVEDFSQKEKFEYNFTSCRQPKPLTEQEKILLYRATRELLINIAKHSQAKNVAVNIKIMNNDIQIVVRDDGVGFDVTKLGRKKGKDGGFGLFSLRERLANIGGNMDITSAAGDGTMVTLTAPLSLRTQRKGE